MSGLTYDWLRRRYEDWLLDDMSEAKYNYLVMMDGVPFVGGYHRSVFATRDMDLYLDRHGLDYSDILNPYNVPTLSANSSVVRQGVNFVSKNIDLLYGEESQGPRSQVRLDNWL